MFHIKTDIRQYRCESEDKVKRLIRNWVIRPADLIYDASSDAWEEIGEHAAFREIFAVIAKEEASEPDTVVTEAPSEIAAQFEVAPGSEHDSAPLPLLPPEPPEGVEGLVRDSDEITMMTDRTLDILREEAGPGPTAAPIEEAPAAQMPAPQPPPEEPPKLGRHGLPEEVFITDEIHREDVFGAMLDELGALDGGEEPRQAPVEEEVTQLVEREQFLAQDRAAAQESAASAVDEQTDETLERARPDALSIAPDEIQQDGAPLERADGEDPEDAERARWRIVLADEEQAEHAPDEAHADEALTAHPVDDDDLDAMLSDAAALVGLDPEDLARGDELIEVKVEHGDVDGLFDDDFADEPSQGAPAEARPSAAAQAPRSRKNSKKKLRKVDPFISDVSDVELPFEIAPSAESVRLGLKHSKLSKEAKDAVFAMPVPPKIGELITREFDLAAKPELPAPAAPAPQSSEHDDDIPPFRDYSALLVLGFLAFLVVALLIGINVLN